MTDYTRITRKLVLEAGFIQFPKIILDIEQTHKLKTLLKIVRDIEQ